MSLVADTTAAGTQIPAIPLRTPMLVKTGELSRTWVLFFEQLCGAVSGLGGITEETTSGGGLAGVAIKTANYTALPADTGLLIVFNSATAVTLTLPATSPSATWFILLQNIGAGALTIAPGGPNLDGAATSLTVPQNQGLIIATDATDYYTSRGAPGVLPYDLIFSYPGAPPVAYTLWVINFTRTVTYAANFSGSRGACGTNPSATAIYTVKKNSVAVGTVTISTSGVFTFATSAGAVTYTPGDTLQMVTPAGDLTLADVTITLSGTR